MTPIVSALMNTAKTQASAIMATQLGVPLDAARRWLRRFAAPAVKLRVGLWAMAHALDPELEPIVAQGAPFTDAVEPYLPG